jgi:hypothetical protein
MSKEILIIVVGIFLIIQTQFGIPDSWHTWLVVVLGIVLILLGFFQRTEALTRGAKVSRSLPFKESAFTDSTQSVAPEIHHDRKEGIGSFN